LDYIVYILYMRKATDKADYLHEKDTKAKTSTMP